MRAHQISLMLGAVAAVLVAAAVTAESATRAGERVLGTPCLSDWDCNVWIQFSECQLGICRCQAAYITQNNTCMIHTNELCPHLAVPSLLCADPHASCVQEPYQYPSGWWSTLSWCRCDAGFLHDAEHDQCRPAMGQQCLPDVPCITGACNATSNLCVCADGSVPSTDGLSCLSGLGATCTTTEECADDHATCIDGVCACSVGFQTSSKPGDALPVCRKRLGAGCTLDVDCAPVEAGCVDKTLRAPAPGGTTACVCREGYVPSDGNESCLPVQGVLGGACSSAAQCAATWGRHAACSGGVCACAAGHVYEWQAVTCVRQ